MSPSVVLIQETKLYKKGKLRLDGYQTFELVRTKTTGGGLSISALESLDPVLISEGDDEVEILTIEVQAGQTGIRIVNGYGPQLDDNIQKKNQFWARMDEEANNAEEDNKGLVIGMVIGGFAVQN